MAVLELRNGYDTLLDDADLAWASQWSWQVKHFGKNPHPYAVRNRKREGGWGSVSLHRALMDAPPGVAVDHANGDTLDNRRANLRLATRGQNRANARKRAAGCSSPYKGVCWNKKSRRWQAAVGQHGGKRYLGLFETEEAAARAYDQAAIENFGEFARLNFPHEHEGREW